MIRRSQLLASVVALVFMSVAITAEDAIPVPKIIEEYSTSKRIGCIAQLEGYHFNLKELSMPIDEEDRTKSPMYELDFQDVNGTSTIQFNLCGETIRRCPDLLPDSANIVNSVGTCNHLSRIYMEGEQKPGTLSLISQKNPELGVVMNFEGGNMCNDTSKYSLSVQINCNSNLDKTTYALDKESLKSPCDPRVIMNSPHACPVLSSGPLQKFLDEYNYWIGIPMILIGGYLLGAGGRFPGITLALFSTLAIGVFQVFCLYIFVLPAFSPSWTVPIVLIVSLGMGVGMGWGAAKWPKIGVMIMGASLGALLGMIIYWSFMSASVSSTTSKIVTICGIALFTAIVYIIFFDHMVIMTSAIFGAYILIRGISMYTGGYVNEFTVVLASQGGDINEIRWTMWLFWILMALCAIGSIQMQLNDRATNLNAYKYKHHNNADFQNYNSMRERITRMGSNRGGNEGDSYYGDQTQMDGEDENEPLNNRYR